MRRRRAALFPLLLLAGIVAACGLWLRAQRRQYALNRALIVALVKGDTRQSLVLVNEGADPNTPYKLTPAPSLLDLVKQLFHRSPQPMNHSPTALMIACGAPWNDNKVTAIAQYLAPDAPQLVQAMLRHGAKVNVMDESGRTPLWRAILYHRLDTVRLLLEHGADVNVKNKDDRTALLWAVIVGPDTAIIRQLMVHRADPNYIDKFGYTPLVLEQIRGRSDVIALLKQYGAKDTGQRL